MLHVHGNACYMFMEMHVTCSWKCMLHVHGNACYMFMEMHVTCSWKCMLHVHVYVCKLYVHIMNHNLVSSGESPASLEGT